MGGIYEGTDLADKTFYGFQYDPSTGNLTINIINDGTAVYQDDYAASFFSSDAIGFQFGSKGHLLMRFY